MKIQLKKIGPIEDAELELGRFSILCGKNNTGKTYVTYLLYCFLDFWNSEYEISLGKSFRDSISSTGTGTISLAAFKKDANTILARASKEFSTPEILSKVFAANSARFEKSSFLVTVNTDEIKFTPPISRSEFSLGNGDTRIYLSISYAKDKECLDVSVSKDLVSEDGRFIYAVIRRVADVVKKTVFSSVLPSPHISSAERTGAAIFRKDLDFAMSKIVEVLRDREKTQNFNPLNFLKKFSSGYPIPVRKNVDFIRDLASVELNKSFITQEHSYILDDFSSIIGGAYKSEKGKSLVYYIPSTNKREKLTLAESSSCVRTLLDLYYYLKHVAREGDLLMIDEPEMNLHPGNQRKLARLLSALVGIGVNVYITTHSDYITKELSTLIVLKNKPSLLKVLEENKIKDFKEYHLLESSNVKAYTAEPPKKRKKGKIELTPVSVSSEEGIDAPNFDETIDVINSIHNLIFWS